MASRINTSSGSNYTGASTTTPAAAAQSLSAGNFIVVTIRTYTSTPVVNSVTDTAGNTYHKAVGRAGAYSGTRVEIWYAYNTLGHGSNVVTANMSGSVQYWGINTAQYDGMLLTDPLDVTATGDTSAGTSITSGAFTTNYPDELIITGADYDSSVGQTWTAGSGYAIATQDASLVQVMQEKFVSSIQSSVTASMTLGTSRNLSLNVATFRQIPAATPADDDRAAEITGDFGWEIQRRTDGGSWDTIEALIQVDEVTGTYTYIDTSDDLEGGHEYCYRVRNVTDDSDWSNIDCVEYAVGTDVNDSRSAEITGAITIDDDRAAEIHGEASTTSSRPSEIHGEDTTEDARGAEITGAVGVDSSRAAEVHGEASVDDDRGAEITGSADTDDDRAAEIHGEDQTDDARGAEISGAASTDSSRGAEIHGTADIGDDRGAEIHGLDDASDSRGAEIEGSLGANAARAAEIHGEDVVDDERAAEITGALGASSSRGAEISGVEGASDIRGAEIHGEATADDDRAAEIHGTADTSDTRASEIHGELGVEDTRGAEVSGQDSAAAQRAAEIAGIDTTQASRAAEITGSQDVDDSRAAEIHGIDIVEDARAAEIYGSQAGASERGAEIEGRAGSSDSRGAEITGKALARKEFKLYRKSPGVSVTRDGVGGKLRASTRIFTGTRKGKGYGVSHRGGTISST